MLDELTMSHIRDIIEEQDKLLRDTASGHAAETGHTVEVFQNFINCEGCDFHAHTAGQEVKLIRHNGNYTVCEEVLP